MQGQVFNRQAGDTPDQHDPVTATRGMDDRGRTIRSGDANAVQVLEGQRKTLRIVGVLAGIKVNDRTILRHGKRFRNRPERLAPVGTAVGIVAIHFHVIIAGSKIIGSRIMVPHIHPDTRIRRPIRPGRIVGEVPGCGGVGACTAGGTAVREVISAFEQRIGADVAVGRAAVTGVRVAQVDRAGHIPAITPDHRIGDVQGAGGTIHAFAVVVGYR